MELITLFDPWKAKICSCPLKYSISPYTGCSHGCLYCYASSYIKNFFFSRPKKDFLKKLEREIKKIPKNSFITMANSSDPYLSLEKDLKLTQKTLKILKNYSLKIMIVTKSSLVLRDLEIIKNFKKIVISISLTTLDEKLAKKLEPFASLVYERLKAIEVLSKNIPVVCRLDPLIYPLTTKKIKETIKELKLRGAKQIITSTYKAKPDNLKRMVKAFGEFKKLWERLYFKEGERYGNYFYLPKDLRKKLIEEVRSYTLKEKMEFSSCREGLKNLNTRNCDGSFFF